VLEMLNVAGRQWTARSIRLWFNNNRNHYVQERRVPTQRLQPPPPFMQSIPPYPIPMPPFYPYGYVPIGVQPIPPPAMWPPPQPIMTIPHDPANPPQNPGYQGPTIVQYFPLPTFNLPRR
jgi:hypothetical protein